mmetsp:Transcript_88508/g.245897  ORF Transcript_88508/g.245897 Transcript_88508/m.245897 type:complete len:553 (+) Transcript_88508:62-1720(+)
MDSQLMAALSSGNAGQRRNALLEIGNEGEYGAANMGYHEQAYALLNDPETPVQVAAISALGYMGRYGAEYCDALVAKLTSSSEKEVRKAAIQAIGYFGELSTAYGAAVESCLDDADLDLVVEACIALGSMKHASSAGKVAAKLKESDTEVVIGACIGLGSMDAEVEALARMLESQEPRVRAAAVGAMPKDKAAGYIATACKMLADADVYVRINAMNLISTQGDKAAAHAPDIGKLLESSEVGVRVAAAAALGGIGEKAESEVGSLEKLLADTEEDTASLMMSVAGVHGRVPAVRRKPACAAAAALGAMGGKAAQCAPKLAEMLGSEDPEVRISCITALGKMGEAGAKFEDQLVYLLEDPQPMVIGAACTAIGSLAKSTNKPSSTAAGKMAELLKHGHPAVKGAALGGLGNMGEEEASVFLEDFVKCFNDNVGYVRAQAIGAITSCGEHGQMYAVEICRLMFDEEVRVRAAAVRALPTMGERGAAFAPEVASLLEDPMPEVRVASIKALGSFGGEALAEYMPYIKQMGEEDPDPEVRTAAQEVVSGGMKALEE